MRHYEAPGMAIAVLKNGKAARVAGYGRRPGP